MCIFVCWLQLKNSQKTKMKKLLIISSFLLGGFLFAQEEAYQINKSESGISISPRSEKPITLKEIKNNFYYKKYSNEILKKLIKIAEKDATFFESIPGEIIGWESTDKGKDTQTRSYQIKNGNLKEVNTTIGETDLKKLNKYIPKKSYFILNSGLYDETKYPSVGRIIKKLKNGEFLIVTLITLRSINEQDKLYEVEYTSHNFKTFTLKRFKENETEKWEIVK